jgi:glycosyltransferase involved in cell wall biosynthesis
MQEQDYRRAESGDQTEDTVLKAKAERGLSVTALICTLNEEGSLPHVLPRVPDWVDEVLLVDGHSTDNTVAVATELRPDVRVLYQPGRGKGDALRYGIEQANGAVIVTLDADGTTDPEDMPRFIEPLLHGYDFVKGSRFRLGLPANKPRHRILGNWMIAMTFDILFFRTHSDLCSGYNAFWKKALEKVDLSGDQFEDEPLINVRVRKAGLKVKEVGHVDRGRVGGDSKSPSWRQGFGAIKTIVRERFHG